MFIIQFTRPYTGAVTTQSFPSRDDAERMIAFYASCGVHARFILWNALHPNGWFISLCRSIRKSDAC